MSEARQVLALALLVVLFPAICWAEALPIRPDDQKTPGAIASQDQGEVCGRQDGKTYSQRHRQTSQALKVQVYKSYGIVKAGREFEVDHRLPLSLGGADILANLWPQEGFQRPSFHDKDRLELELWERVCKRGQMGLAEAQGMLLAPADWIESYKKIFGASPGSAAGASK